MMHWIRVVLDSSVTAGGVGRTRLLSWNRCLRGNKRCGTNYRRLGENGQLMHRGYRCCLVRGGIQWPTRSGQRSKIYDRKHFHHLRLWYDFGTTLVRLWYDFGTTLVRLWLHIRKKSSVKLVPVWQQLVVRVWTVREC